MSRRIWVGIIIVLIGIFAVGVVTLSYAKVPKVVGLEKSSAQNVLGKVPLSAELEEKYSNKPKGTIIFQTPQAGSNARKGSIVKLAVSKGLPKVPKMVGLPLGEAEEKLQEDEEARLGIETKEKYHNNLSKGVVISQNPSANTSVAVGTIVSLVVSSGRPVVPNLTGKSKGEAMNLVQDSKETRFTFASKEEYSESISKGKVIRQDPKANSSASIGSTVRVVVSKGSKPKPPPPLSPKVVHSCGACSDCMSPCPCPSGTHTCDYGAGQCPPCT